MWRMFLGVAPVIVSGWYIQNPTLGTDGVLHAQHSGSLYAVNSDGSTKWSFDQGAVGRHVEGLNGTVYATTATWGTASKVRDTLYAVDSADGSMKWKHQVDENEGVGMRYNPLAVAPDGTIYFASVKDDTGPSCESTTIAAIETNGTLRWTTTIAGCGSLSAVGRDGTLFVRNDLAPEGNGSLYALRPDSGTAKWHWALNECHSKATIAFSEDGHIFLMQRDLNCSKLTLTKLRIEDCTWLWDFSFSAWTEGWPIHFFPFMNLGSNSEVYVNGVTENGTCSLRVFDFNGNPLRNLPCLRGSTRYGDEEDVFVTVSSGTDPDTNYVWAHSGSDGSLLWNISFHDHLVGMDQERGEEVRFGQDGTVFVWSQQGMPHMPFGARQTYAIRNGEMAWNMSGTQQVMSGDGTTYVQGLTLPASPTSKLEIVAVGADGAEKWRCHPESVAEFV